MPRIMSRVALVSLAAMFVASCGEIPSAPKVVPDEALLAPAQSTPGLTVTPSSPTILIGQSLTLTVTNANGSAINKKAVWTSSDTSIAIVVSTGTSNGRVTGRRSGTATITAASGNKSSNTSVSVVPVPVRSVRLSPDSARVELGETVQYSATPRDSAGNALSNRVVSWSVTDFGVATIDNNGLVTTGGRGSTRVIATVEGVADTTWLIVQQTPTRIELVERSIIFDALGETRQLIASVYDTRNHLITDAVVSWSSSADTIATVDANGVVTPVTHAQSAWTFVSASLGGLADTATVTVYRWPTSVIASPDTMFINELTPPGTTSGQFTAVMNDRNGFAINGGWLLWEALDPGIVSVAMDGGVVAHANGVARVVAISFSGIQDTVVVVVDAAPAEGTSRLTADAFDLLAPFGFPSRTPDSSRGTLGATTCFVEWPSRGLRTRSLCRTSG
jgi:uncharacterized protein YjdB